MACTKAALLNTFNQAVNIFNTESDNTIGGLLDENVTVYSHKHVSYSGIADVEDYFRQEFAKHAHFTPSGVTCTVSSSGMTGKVSGKAAWKSDTAPNGETFLFEFQFVCENNQWSLLNLDCFNESRHV